MSADYLFGGTPPPSVNITQGQNSGLPEWYQQYLNGIAGKATDLAGQAQAQPVPAQNVAGFTPDQTAAFNKVRENQGAWRPDLAAATTAASGIAPGVQAGVANANAAVAGPSADFTSNYKQYMSPYTQSVVDNISRLGNQNFNENIMPGVNSSMIGAGQFGSTRNADLLGRAARDTQTNISGLQAGALEAGYGTASNIFASDANRAQQQQQMQGNMALQGAGATSTGLGQAAGSLGALGQATSALGLGDAQTLGAAGNQQQQLNQAGLDTSFNNANTANQQPWTNLNNLNSVVRGMQLPTSSVSTTNTPLPTSTYGAGTLGALGQAYGTTSTSGK